MLRIGLGTVLGAAPHRIRFRYGAAGKPYVWRPAFGRSLEFNLSYTGRLAVYACAFGRAVGIDIERIEEQTDLLDVADNCFSPLERRGLRELPPGSRTAAFYRCWTRKEAYVKASGSGLTAPLDRFDVTLRPHEPAALLRVHGDPAEAARWRMTELALPAGYVGALVTQVGC
jgi:4'-phosphopantetheinyl transferase